MQNRTYFPMDNSGIVHMASLKPGKSNSFRFEVRLNEAIRPELLNQAFHAITPRFPMLVAGIRSGLFRYYVVPVDTLPNIEPDRDPLAYMPRGRLKKCAMRVLYSENTIAAEFFHSLTDGYGGSVFLKALLAEYLKLAHGFVLPEATDIPLPIQHPATEEIEDSFLTHAGEHMIAHNAEPAYLPCTNAPETQLHTSTGIFNVTDLLRTAHRYGVSLTTFLTAVLAESVMELQQHHDLFKRKLKPVQIMVPANLRKHFPSTTLRNFSLFAMARMGIENIKLSFEDLVHNIDRQLKAQLTKEHFASIMATNASLDKNWLLRSIPLTIKCALMRIGYRYFGECTSSISLSNLGDFHLPKEMHPYIQRIGVFLTPRTISPYNCGAISFNGRLYLNFSRSCSDAVLEPIFFQKLITLGCVPTLLTGSLPSDVKLPAATI